MCAFSSKDSFFNAGLLRSSGIFYAKKTNSDIEILC